MTNTQRIETLEEKIDLLILLTSGGDEFNSVVDGNPAIPLTERIKLNEAKLQALIEHFNLREYNGIKYERITDVRAIGFDIRTTPEEE